MKKLSDLFQGEIKSKSLAKDFEKSLNILPELEEAKSFFDTSISKYKTNVIQTIYSVLKEALDDKNDLFSFVESALKFCLTENTLIQHGEYIDEIVLSINIANIISKTEQEKVKLYINESWKNFGQIIDYHKGGSSDIDFYFKFN
jgi:hypothetical protein